MITEAQVRKIALSLPDASERESYGGAPSWRTSRGMFTWIRTAPDALVVWVDSLDAKELLLEHEPKLFFTTSHYDGHAILLVRMDKVDLARARALIEDSYKQRAPKTKTKAKTKAAPPPKAAKAARSSAQPSATKPAKRPSPAKKRAPAKRKRT